MPVAGSSGAAPGYMVLRAPGARGGWRLLPSGVWVAWLCLR